MSHLEDLLGSNPVRCSEDHDTNNAYGVTVWFNSDVRPEMLKIRGMGEHPDDWYWATVKFGLTADSTGLLTCWDCEGDRPTRLALIAANIARANQVAPDHDELDDDLVHCPECDTDFNADEMVQVRYCSFCELTFNGTDNGRNCENCNRPFTRKCAENGCPECLSEDSECEAKN